MRKLLISLILALIVIGCEKHDTESNTKPENLTYYLDITKDCEIDTLANFKNFEYQPDTVIYTINGDSLNIIVGFNHDCAAQHNTFAEIQNDTIFISIDRIDGPIADCNCYFISDFQFTGIVEPYYYEVSIDDYRFFYGYIESVN